MTARSALRRVFDVRQGEGAFVLVLWLAYLVVVLGLRVGWGATTALFLKVVGVRWLPAVLMARALASLVATTLYAAYADRVRNDRLFLVILGVGAGSVIAAAAIAAATPVAGAVLLFIVARAASTVFFLHWGVYLSEFFRPPEARRLYPGIFSGARVGGLLGGAALATLPDVVGTTGLMLLFAAALVAGGVIVRLSAGARFDRFRNTPTRQPSAAPAGAPGGASPRARRRSGGWPGFANLRDGLRYVRRSRFLLWTAACTVLLVWTRNILLVANNTVFESAYPDTASLTEFFGWYALVAGVVALVLQLGAAGRVIARFGIARPNLAYSAALAASALGLTVAPALPAAILSRFAENELRTTLKVPVHNLLYNAVDAKVRARARATSSGLTVPLAALGVNGLLLVLQPALPVWALAGIAAAFGAVYVWATRRQNHEFVRTLAARATSEALGQDDVPPTPTPLPRADLDAAVRTLTDPGASNFDRIQANRAAPASRLERGPRDAVARALAAELEAATALLAYARGASSRDRDRARLLALAADRRCRYGLALAGSWIETRITHAVFSIQDEPRDDVVARVAPMQELATELLSPRAADALVDAAGRYARVRSGRESAATLPAEAVDFVARWNDRWLAGGLLLLGDEALRTRAEQPAREGGLLDVPAVRGPESERWRSMTVLDRVALFLHYPLAKDLSLADLESLARSPTGGAVAAELLGEGAPPGAEPGLEDEEDE